MPKKNISSIIDTIQPMHIQLLGKEDQKWFLSECARVNKTLGYSLHRRASGDDAFRLFLMAEKGMSPEEVVPMLISLSR